VSDDQERASRSMPADPDEILGYLKLTNYSIRRWHAAVTRAVQIIGRSHMADILVPREFSSISRAHAKVWVDTKGCWIEDVGSTFGIKLNGIRLQPHVPVNLKFEDRIQLGEVEFQLKAPSTDKLPSNEPDSEAITRKFDIPDRKTDPPRVDLNVLSHAELRIVLLMQRGLVSHGDIAREIHRSPNTIRKQMESIFKKLKVHSRHELLAKLMAK
jgi:DNA-binding CsgD family transcriptional regulator